jgi:Holliday junction resolvase RusA-like endonuclease
MPNIKSKDWYRQSKKPVLRLTYRSEPLTKSNQTFFGRGRAYIPQKVQDYEKELQEAASTAVKKARLKRLKGFIIMEIWYYVGSKRRKDLPNLPKTTTDALNETVYHDDFQIHDMVIHRRLDREDPRVEITLWETRDAEWDEN